MGLYFVKIIIMEIQIATLNDLDEILKIYEVARNFMKSHNNPDQWKNHNPKVETILSDIKNNNLYIIKENNCICGVFALIFGDDATYKVIEKGNWLSNSKYATIHRLASNQKVKGIFNEVISYSLSKIKHLRIDTHKDNKVMQHLIIKAGFTYCGIIYVNNHEERLAYELIC